MDDKDPTQPVRHAAPARCAYPQFFPLQTRWSDNDVYGHVNNVVYYSYFDTAVNGWLIDAGVLDIHAGGDIGLVVETQCHYYSPLAFPQRIEAGLRVGQTGRCSVRYEIALFAQGAGQAAAAGHFVHVYVDRATRRPVALPPALLQAIQLLLPGKDTK